MSPVLIGCNPTQKESENMSPNDTKWFSNNDEWPVDEPESRNGRSESVVKALRREFPGVTATIQEGKYVDRLTINLENAPQRAEKLVPVLYAALTEGPWLQETLYWNYHRGHVQVTGITLIRDR